jgi:hypothetical protein
MACKRGPGPAPRRAAVPQRAARTDIKRYVCRLFEGVLRDRVDAGRGPAHILERS